ncbi:hypothetical protein [Halorarum salinum]|uniref:Uncharacterized protein n=1 Tax=Halorarum salinum TaxID=2743089 RepID=A0A7D5Q964_9EURY|nr:hypothetical protein [Halobaculum salinum]QLG60499.1 hypothetical protein HUG12_01535 [Halobaculum salinum]
MYDESQPEPITEPDTPNATKFHPDDENADYPSKDRLDGMKSFIVHYSRLRAFNKGIFSYKWGDNPMLQRQDSLTILDAVAGYVELNPLQKKVARMEMDRALFQKWSSPAGIDKELIAVCICAIVLRNDCRSDRAYHPNRNDENNDELFVHLMEGFSYQDTTVRRCIQKVQGHIQWSSVDWKEAETMLSA